MLRIRLLNARPLLIVLLAFSAISVALGQARRVIAAPTGLGGSAPSAVVSDAGYLALAYFDEFRLQMVDLGLHPLGEPIVIEGPRPFAKIRHNELLAVEEGFLLVSEDQVYAVLARPLDHSGRPTGLVEDLEAHSPFGARAAHHRSGSTVVTYGSIFPNPFAWVRPVTDDGVPRDVWRRIAPKRISGLANLLIGDVLQVPVAPIGQAFFSAWIDQSSGLYVRDIDRNGVPFGASVQVVPVDECPHHVAVASLGLEELIVFSSGCGARSLSLTKRFAEQEQVADPTPLDLLAPADRFPDASVLTMTATLDRVGVLYEADRNAEDAGWVFYELDSEGTVLDGPIDLEADLGGREVRQAALDVDRRLDRFVVSWVGDGPEGPGLYLALPTDVAR
ncbi:MAG: hypothetical protein JSV80_12090 [Acidobacteriota bacterium]|nr:MAG: hypothetical protein JSV80_12090 [Acidobacteriota bacterium]